MLRFVTIMRAILASPLLPGSDQHSTSPVTEHMHVDRTGDCPAAFTAHNA